MDADRIGLVLAKTSELRSKIISSIRETTSNVEKEGKETEPKQESGENQEDEEEKKEEAEILLNIRDALESLEGQLSSLQALQQQQWYEKEAALAEIEYSQKKLLKELKEYKGKDLEVINEAIAFASETEENTDLLLPPYPTRPSHSLLSDNNYLSSFPSRKLTQNGTRTDDLKELNQSVRNQKQSGPLKLVKDLIGASAKGALTIVGVVAILCLAGFEPRLRKRDNEFTLLDLFNMQKNSDGKGDTVECPPGKVLVMGNGEMRCVVKERVEVPFVSVVNAPDVSYGCG